jgi:uncharacterized GH25 family protein
LVFVSASNAHEFILKPVQFHAEPGTKLPFSVLATHFFMTSEEMEPVQTVQVWLVEGDNKTSISLKENQILQTLDGVASLKKKGTALLVGHLQEPIETVTADGLNKTQRVKREKFCKTLITVTKDDDNYKKILGQKLEIVPVSNVLKARVGEELAFRILFDGKPLKSQVYATYDGFSRRYNTYTYATETLDDGLAYVKVTSPGTWMVRVEKRIEETGKDYDLYALKAALIFSVQ